ncbi:MAG: flavin reductase family protein [Verrucomicrobiota bacterium]
MELSFAHDPDDLAYRLLSSLVVPRPIAWITSMNEDGLVNAAPFSFFNLMGDDPPIVALGIGPTEASADGLKDTARNIRRGGEFVIHVVPESMLETMNLTSADFPPGESETTAADIRLIPSTAVKVPRMAEALAAMECRLEQVVEIGNTHVTLGRVLHLHLDDHFYDAEKQYVRTELMHLVGRMHGRGWYAGTTDLRELPRTSYAAWKAANPDGVPGK